MVTSIDRRPPRYSPESRFGKETGQTALFGVLTLSLMTGGMGLAVDLGWSYYVKQQIQTAADSAASAAVIYAKTNNDSCSTITCGTSYTCSGVSPATSSLQAGCLYATANAPAGVSVTMLENNAANPPTVVSGVTPTMWVQATVTATTHNLFSSILTGTVSASAIGGVVTTGSGIAPCIYVLNPTATNAFDAGNGVTINTTSCGVYVNSNASTAMLVTGGAKVNSTTIDVVGGVTKNNGGTTSSTPVTGVAATPDPFSGLGVPTAPANNASAPCANYNGNYSAWVAGGYTLCPGTYSSGILLSNGNSAVMQSGTYVVSGGPFSIQSGPLTATGPVLIYLSGSSAYANIANGTTVTLSAPSTGSYEGVLFYQDRTVASPQTSTIAGGANMSLSGSLYFPHAAVNINNGTNSQTGALVCGTVNFQGGATFKSGTQAQTGIAAVSSSVASLLH